MKSKTVLVTGGAGFIGSHVVDQLLAQGNQVVVIDNFNTDYAPSIKKRNIDHNLRNPNFELIESDIRDKTIFSDAFEKFHVDLVVHLAALGGVRASLQRPYDYWSVNAEAAINILQAMKEADINRWVFASSSSVYGNRDQGPFKEDDNTDNPNSPYSASKKALEVVAKTYANLYDIQTTGLRFFNVYGPRNRPNMACSNFTHAFLNDLPIIKYGTGETGRDYTYIDDIVDGVIKAIENPFDHEIINLGNSTPVTLNELIQTFEEVFGKPAKINQQDPQPGDIKLTFADNSKAKKLLKWQPKTSLKKGIKKLVAWYKKNLTPNKKK